MFDLVANVVGVTRQLGDVWGPSSRWPQDSHWLLVSDYSHASDASLEYPKNLTWAYTFLHPADGFDETCEAINTAMPRDIKATSAARLSEASINCLRSENMFHMSFVVDPDAALFRDMMTIDYMKQFFEEMSEAALIIAGHQPDVRDYYTATSRHMRDVAICLSGKNPALRKLRLMLITAALTAGCCALLTEKMSPRSIRWISDRDVIADIHKGVLHDLAQMLYVQQWHTDAATSGLNSATMQTYGHTLEFDPLIRLPDYIAGIAADFNFSTGLFTNEKFYPLASSLFTAGKNHALLFGTMADGILTFERRTLIPRS